MVASPVLWGLHMPSWQWNLETPELPVSAGVCKSGKPKAVAPWGLSINPTLTSLSQSAYQKNDFFRIFPRPQYVSPLVAFQMREPTLFRVLQC